MLKCLKGWFGWKIWLCGGGSVGSCRWGLMFVM